MRLQLHVLLQALEDILNYELNLPHAGDSSPQEAEEHYFSALTYISKYPSLMKKLNTIDKKEWLKEIQRVREDLS